MADNTLIEWTDATWNPITGCEIVSPGCKRCYAMKLAGTRLKHVASRAGLTIDTKAGPVWNGQTRFNEAELLKPLRWKRPRRIFVCAHGDLFAESVPDEWIDRVFAVMALSPQHTFQVLTKRAKRMREYIEGIPSKIPFLGRMPLERIHLEAAGHMEGDGGFMEELKRHDNIYSLYLNVPWPLPNVWLGVSAEDQIRADERIPDLLATPAAIRFVSAEPLLGPIDFNTVPRPKGWPNPVDDISDGIDALRYLHRPHPEARAEPRRIDWIIVGGESGQGARPMHPDWARQIRDQCASAGVAFFFKQWGSWGLEEPRFGSHEQFALAIDGTLYQSSDLAFPDGKRRAEALRADHKKADLHAIYKVGKKHAGRLLDGIEHNAMPADRP